jgi:hypothetical protein
VDESRLRNILADELEKASGLPDNAPEHLARIRIGVLTPDLTAAIAAMRRAVMEDREGVFNDAPATLLIDAAT